MKGALAVALSAITIMNACVLQTADCADFVACQRAVDDSVDTSPWDEGGSCWTLPDTARSCDAQCKAALDALRALSDAPAECAP